MSTAAQGESTWELRLYVADMTPTAQRALSNLRQICDAHLHGRYTLEIVDLHERPGLAEADQIVAVPTLIRRAPPPIRKVIGDLSNTSRVLTGLELPSPQPSTTRST